jgi:hypothetical protein
MARQSLERRCGFMASSGQALSTTVLDCCGWPDVGPQLLSVLAEILIGTPKK